MNEKRLSIVKYYGIKTQQRKLAEECFELNEAVTIFENNNSVRMRDLDHIAEEIGDVFNIIKGFQLKYGFSDDYIQGLADGKINRQIKRMEEE